MTASCPLPVRASVRDLLTDLLSSKATVEIVQPQQLEGEDCAYASSYVRDDDSVAAACICDHGLAAAAGAAIGMVPAHEAEEERRKGLLEGDLEEFFHEVVNVFAKLLNSPTTPHVRLDRVYPVPGEVPADLAAVVTGPQGRADYRVTIEGYGSGRLWVLVR